MTTTLAMLDSAKAMREIAARAGMKSGKVVVYFATYEDYPPTLQRVGKGGKILKQRKNERARGSRRVLVGRSWLRKNAPELWAVFIAARLVDGDTAVLPTQAPRNR